MSDEGSRAPAYIDFWLPSLALRQSGRGVTGGGTVQRVPKPRSLDLASCLAAAFVLSREPRMCPLFAVLGPPRDARCQPPNSGELLRILGAVELSEFSGPHRVPQHNGSFRFRT